MTSFSIWTPPSYQARLKEQYSSQQSCCLCMIFWPDHEYCHRHINGVKWKIAMSNSQVVDYSAFIKGYLHPHSPNDLGTSMPISWCIPMACQPLPFGFCNLLKSQTLPLWIVSLHIKWHFLKRKYPSQKGLFVMTMMVSTSANLIYSCFQKAQAECMCFYCTELSKMSNLFH